MEILRKFTVEADAETGLWITEPIFAGTIQARNWYAKKDNARWHFDTYEAIVDCGDDGLQEETRAIAVKWIK